MQVTLERAMAPRAPAERLGSGKLYAVGGSEGNGNHLSSVERFDPEAGCWEEVDNPNPGTNPDPKPNPNSNSDPNPNPSPSPQP